MGSLSQFMKVFPAFLALCLFGIAFLALIPLFSDWLFFKQQQWSYFLIFSTSSASIGGILFYRVTPFQQISTKEAFLLVFCIWFFGSVIVSFPFYLCTPLSMMGSWFEAMSSITTTGLSLLHKNSAPPKSILLWKALLQWIGGLGVVAIAIAVFPKLRIGGTSLLYKETQAHSEKPKITQLSKSLIFIYGLFSVLGTLLLWISGLTFFEAFCHSLSSISTSGNSLITTNQLYTPSIQLVTIMLMILGGSPFWLYIKCIREYSILPLKDSQLTTYLSYICVLSLVFCLLNSHTSLLKTVLDSCFCVTSAITSTGFGCESNLLALSFFASFVGGCTGSTAGGIKIFRVQALLAMIKCHLYQIKRPKGIYIPLYDGMPLSENLILSIVSFVVLYIFVFLILSIIFCLLGLDLLKGLMLSATCLGNSGMIPIDHLTHLQKFFAMIGMILGRLEIVTVFLLFMPSFWKK